MKKTLFLVALMLTIVVVFTACGESSDSQGGQDETKMIGQSVDLLSCDDGELTFIGFQKADPKLTDEDNAYVFIYEYTNHTEDPSMSSGTFRIEYYQNGSELSPSAYHVIPNLKQIELLQADSNKALKDGTVRFGELRIAKDDSQITVMAHEKSNKDNSAMIEIDLSDGIVKGGDTSDSSSDSTNSVAQLSVGETAKTDVVEMTLTKSLFGKKVALENGDAYHMPTTANKGLVAGDGNTYFIFDFDVKNVGKKAISGSDICAMDSKNKGYLWTLDYNDGYIFDNGDYADLNLVFGGNYNYNPIIDPLGTSHFRGIIKCAEEIETNESAPLILHVVLPTSNGSQEFDFKVR